ncbi:MAG: DUF2085 domain-containing protein [Chloroflexi bacterium]|nr:DUF2085 domain-containing protein [Chloroflexota bacterium]
MAVADPATEQQSQVTSRPAITLALIALALVFTAWYLYAPPGAMGKATAIGYAICHRISVRSFFAGEIQLPLCARCTGIYLGLMAGVAFMAIIGRGRAGVLPPTRAIMALVLFITVMGVDGVNSYLTLLPGLPRAYEPQNWLRLLTGLLTGVAVSGLIFPVFNQTLWRNWIETPVVGNLRELAAIVLAAMIVAALVLSGNPYILYPLALISAGGVLFLMTMTNSVIFMLATRTENKAGHWRDAVVPVAAGLAISLALILLIDVGRYTVTGTWDGFVIPGT